jgi:integrase
MSSLPIPFFYQSAWYCNLFGKRTYLVAGTDDERQAWRKGHRADYFCVRSEVREELKRICLGLPAATTDTPSSITVADAVAKYLNDRQGEISPAAWKVTNTVLKDFSRYCGTQTLASITVGKVIEWKKSHPRWRKSGWIRTCYKKVLQLMNFAVRENLLPTNHLRGHLKLGPEGRRETLITREQEHEIWKDTPGCYGMFFRACLLSGRRPNEVAKLTKASVMIDAKGRASWQVKGKNYSKTGLMENVPLCPDLQSITKLRMAECGNGPMFPNSHGGMWQCPAWNRPLEKWGLTLYSTRHTYITRALQNGVPIATVATIVGNSVEVLLKHYKQFQLVATDYFMDMAAKAVA